MSRIFLSWNQKGLLASGFKNFPLLIRDLESDSIERKESISDPDRISQAICAFANDLHPVLFATIKDLDIDLRQNQFQRSTHPISDHQGNDQGHHRGHNSQHSSVVKAQGDYLGRCVMYRGIALGRSAENSLE